MIEILRTVQLNMDGTKNCFRTIAAWCGRHQKGGGKGAPGAAASMPFSLPLCCPTGKILMVITDKVLSGHFIMLRCEYY